MEQTKPGPGQGITTLPVNEGDDNSHDDEDGDEGGNQEVGVPGLDRKRVVGPDVEGRGRPILSGDRSHVIGSIAGYFCPGRSFCLFSDPLRHLVRCTYCCKFI